MTYLCSIFFIFVASVDPLSKNKSRIIIQKCRNFCKQLTLPGWYNNSTTTSVFQNCRLYTVISDTYFGSFTIFSFSYKILLLFDLNACTKSGSLRFSQFSGCLLILSVYIIMSFDFPFVRLLGVR
jgi:hypothetical protein